MLPTERFPITIDGTAQPLMLRSMSGHEELGRLFEYELEIFSETFDLKFDAILGKPLTVCLSKLGGTRFFNGIVTRLWRVGTFDRYLVLRATLSPRLWLLRKTTDCRIYQKKSVPTVVKEVLREHAIPFSEHLQADSYKTWDYLTQYRETDFAFLSRIMEREGIYYYFKHTQGGHQLVLSDSISSHDPVPSYGVLPVLPSGSGPSDKDHVTSWRQIHEVTTLGVTLQAHDFRLRRGADILAVKRVSAEHEQDEFQIYDYAGHYVGQENADSTAAGDVRTAGEHYAEVNLDEQRSELDRIEGEGNVRGLEVGALFQFDEADGPTDQYLTVSTQIELRNGALASGDQGDGDLCHVSFTGLDSKRQFRPARISEKPMVGGPETAVVVGQQGEEIWTDKFGRVRVQFHWDREGKSNESSTCWVRVGQMWAGSNWGSIYIPRIGQEVIVQFLGGDPDRPIITGSVYNADNMPPYALPANATQSGIKSRSTKGGGPGNFNEIRFEDKKGAEQLYMQAEKDRETLVKAADSLSVGGSRTKSIGQDETVNVGQKRTETVGADEMVTIRANQTLAVTANRTVTVGANQSETISVAATETIGAAKALTIGAAYQVSVGAAMNETIGGLKAEEIGGAKMVNVGAISTENVGGNKSVNAGANISEKAGGNIGLTAGKNANINAGKNLFAGAGDDLGINAGKKANVVAGDELTLKCGEAVIVLKKNGDITINGKKITIKGNGDVVVKGSKIMGN